jgi:hypothetical protein
VREPHLGKWKCYDKTNLRARKATLLDGITSTNIGNEGIHSMYQKPWLIKLVIIPRRTLKLAGHVSPDICPHHDLGAFPKGEISDKQRHVDVFLVHQCSRSFRISCQLSEIVGTTYKVHLLLKEF